MHAVVRFAAILGLAVLLCACGGSGGGGANTSRDATGGESSPEPDAAPTPVEEPGAAPALSCDGTDRAACPAGYRCVADPTANCDPATGMACAGICVLGDPLPGCGGLQAEPCPDGYACADDPADDCDGGPAVDCPGVCRPVAPNECTDDADCPVFEARCTVCADGSVSCPESRCVNGA